MERSFIATKGSAYIKDLEESYQKFREQKTFIRKFFKEKGIESKTYILSGNGCYNVPFDEDDKKDIFLSIEPTEEDKRHFEKQLTKSDEYGLCDFKRNSKVGKEFAQRCVDEKVIINVYQPSVGDYFKCLSLGGYNVTQFQYKDELYIKIISDRLTNEIPEGFKEIKLSEFHKAEEEYDLKEDCKESIND